LDRNAPQNVPQDQAYPGLPVCGATGTAHPSPGIEVQGSPATMIFPV